MKPGAIPPGCTCENADADECSFVCFDKIPIDFALEVQSVYEHGKLACSRVKRELTALVQGAPLHEDMSACCSARWSLF